MAFFSNGVLSQETLKRQYPNYEKESKLRLYDSRISSIQPNTFDKLTKLEHLFLGNNQIVFIESNTFDKLTNLTWLVLCNNQIESIEPNTFEKLTNLVSLNLKNNKIASIQPNTFDKLTKLESLFLNDNQIASIDPHLFQNSKSFYLINLENNRFTSTIVSFYDASKTHTHLFSLRDGLPSHFTSDFNFFIQQFNSSKKASPLKPNSIPKPLPVSVSKPNLKSENEELLQKVKQLELENQRLKNQDLTTPLVNQNQSLSIKVRELENQIEELNKDRRNLTMHKNDLLSKLAETEGEIKKQNDALQLALLQFNVEKKALNDELIKNKRKMNSNSTQTLDASNFSPLKDDYDRYERGDFLGSGIFGSVFQVRDKRTDMTKAMKLLQHADPTAQNEIKKYMKLSHQNIVRYFDHFDHEIHDEMYTCIVVEYCQNRSLRKQIEKAEKSAENKIAEEKISKWMMEAASGLQYLHMEAIVHRDIKPENLLLTDREVLKIGDLGLSISWDESERYSAGTGNYKSPEHYFGTEDYQNNPYTTDIWALGCVLYELIHLKRAFSDNPRKIWTPAYEKLGFFRPILPQMLEIDPKKRPTAEQLFEVFRTCLRSFTNQKTTIK